jgi:TolB-like protein
MTMIRHCILLAIMVLVLLPSVLCAMDAIAVLPFDAVGVDRESGETAYMLLCQEIRKSGKYEVVPEDMVRSAVGLGECQDAVCAGAIGRKVGAKFAVYGSLNRLGGKIIVSYNLLDVTEDKTVLADAVTSLTVEDLDTVMKRVASSVVNKKPADEVAEVGSITAGEAELPARRKALMTSGIAFGYLYPQNGYEGDEIFALDFLSHYEGKDFDATALFGIRKGVALNIGVVYLFKRTDFCPYLGGGLGFHWVAHEDVLDTDKRADGFEGLARCGLMLFRTYNFRIMVNLDYCYTFNDYDDQALVLTLGITRAGKKLFGIF